MKKPSGVFLLCSASSLLASTVALAQAAPDQTSPSPSGTDRPSAQTEEIIVTGSRTVANGNSSPTPVTVVQLSELLATSPTTIAEGLAKLPSFGNTGRGVSASGLGGANSQGNFLNLRNFGINRNLILQDGRRVAPSAADGTVDTNTLPEMLTQRVDIVTGGASAVYGSDAVTGVINYITDTRFTGLKMEAQRGISSRGDDGSGKFGIAGGASLLDGRMHVIASAQRYQSDGIDNKQSRAAGANTYCGLGNGSTIPIVIAANCRNSASSFGGLVTTGRGAGLEFATNGVLTPFVHGQATNTTNAEIGGDGQFVDPTSLVGSQKTDQLFGRVDYDFGGSIHGFIQGSWNKSENSYVFTQYGIASPYFYSTNNPFLSAAAVAQLGGPNQTFRLARTFRDAGSTVTDSDTRAWQGTAGLDGDFGSNYKWNIFYSRAQTKLIETVRNNVDQGKLIASLDAVRDPATGNIVCNVTLTDPTLYPGCIPVNPFGPTSTGTTGLGFARQDTFPVLKNGVEDLGGTLTGDLFNLPGGPLRAAVTGEYRRESLDNSSNFRPSQTLQNDPRGSCAGLRFGNCSATATTLRYFYSTSEPLSVSRSVYESAVEFTAPVLKDMPFARSLELNGAARYAHYQRIGQAITWKVGVVWRPVDDLTIRATRSRDIRAPTLYDLYRPASATATGFADTFHTGVSSITVTRVQGNPNLVPEVAQTYTVGLVYRPSWLPRLSVAIDYYDINMNNAIGLQAANGANLQICETSGGTSPLCAIFQRPLPFSDRTPANYPTALLPQNLNLSRTWTHGVDGEVNYSASLPPMFGGSDGKLGLRLLLSYQPVLNTIPAPGQAVIPTMGFGGSSKWKVSLTTSYTQGRASVVIQNRWKSKTLQSFNLAYADPTIPAADYTDINLNITFMKTGNATASFFATVQNLFDRKPTITAVPGVAAINFAYPTIPGEDVIGRFFTFGVRTRF